MLYDDSLDLPASVYSHNDATVLALIGEEELDGFSFDGLRRKLGLHQESLSRSLSRLQEMEMIEKEDGGYIVTSKAKDVIPFRRLSTDGSAVPLLHTLLPFNVSVDHVVSDLKGRWFGMLRWLGYSEEDGGVTLKWTTRDGRVQVDANFSDTGLWVEAKLQDTDDMSLAVKASHQLLAYVSEIYSTQEPGLRLSLLSLRSQFMPN